MKLALIGTGKIIEDALFAMEPVKTIERTAVFARPHSRDKAEKLAKQYAIKEVYTAERDRRDPRCRVAFRRINDGNIGRRRFSFPLPRPGLH